MSIGNDKFRFHILGLTLNQECEMMDSWNIVFGENIVENIFH